MVTKQTQRRKFDVKFKEDVLRYAAEHSGEKAAKHFDIDSRQVRYWKKQKDELMAEPDNKRARLPGGGRKRASNEMETQLSDWIRSMQRDEHDRVSRKTIQNKAKEIYLTVSDGGKAFAASKGWLQKFLRRNGPSLRRRTITVAQKRNNPVCRISTVQGKPRRTFDLKFKLAVVKYAEQNSGEAAARHFNVDPKQVREWKQKKGELGSLSAIHGKRVRLSGGGRKKVTEELDSVESRLQVQMNSPDTAGLISVKEEDPEDQPDLNQCVQTPVTMNSPDSSMAISIKQEEPEERQHLSYSLQPNQVSGHVFPAERERSVQLPHPSYDIYFDDSDETQLSQGSRKDHFAVERGSSQQQTATGSGQLGAGTDHEPPDAFEQSVLHSLQELREEGRLEMDTHYFMHFVGHRMDKLNARKKAKLQMAIHQALLDTERSDSD